MRLLALAALVLVACGDDDGEEVVPGRGISRPEVISSSTAGAPEGATKVSDPRAPPSERFLPTPMPSGPIVVTERAEGTEQGPQQPQRDPAEELRGVVGDPSSCLTEEDRQLERDIAFDVSATVLSSGIPSSVVVNAPGVSEEARTCVRRRVMPARFRPFETMTTIQASVVLRRQPAEPT